MASANDGRYDLSACETAAPADRSPNASWSLPLLSSGQHIGVIVGFEPLTPTIQRAVDARMAEARTRGMNVVALGYVEFWLERRDRYFMVFMSSGVTQSDVSVFVREDAVLARFGLFKRCLSEALAGCADDAEVTLRSQLLLCVLNGVAHNLITICAYPWPKPTMLVFAAVTGVLRAELA